MISERGGSIIAPNNQASACTGTPQLAPRGKELIAGGTARGKRLVRMVQQQHLVAPTLYTHMKGLPEPLDTHTHIMNNRLNSPHTQCLVGYKTHKYEN